MNVKDGTAVFKVLDKRMQALVDFFFPVGTIIARDDEEEPEILQYGVWEKIASDRVLQGGGGVNKPGIDVEAGLPNITGWFSGLGNNAITPTDGTVFTVDRDRLPLNNCANIGPQCNKITFNANMSNSIYGNSDTVQPPAHIVTFWKRIK